MLFRNTASQYGGITKTFHWVMAAAIIALLAIGLYMSDLEAIPLKKELIGIHKSLGVCVLFAAVLRMLWHLVSPKPSPLPNLHLWEKYLGKTLQFFFYAAMLAMPLSGWAMSSAAGFPVGVFGLFTLPPLLSPDKEKLEILKEFHGVAGNILLYAVGLHAAGALKHAILNKDATLKRMLPFGRGE